MTKTRRGVRRSLTALRAMPWRDRWLLCQAAVGLVAVEILLAWAGFRRCHDGLARLSRGRLRGRTDGEACADAARAARLVALAARHGPTGSACLAQALVLWGLLRRRGIDAELRFGVAKKDARLDAHAWVDVGGHAVTGDGDVPERYLPLNARAAAPGTGLP